MFDSNLVLCDGSAVWNYANLVTSNYGTPISTTRNSGGFAVLDIVEAPVTGLAVVLILTQAANAAGDELTTIIEECASENFSSSTPHELGKFDVAATTKGVILGSEVVASTIPVVVVMRVTPTRRYLRIDASCTSGDDFGVVYCYATPYAFKVL